MATVQTNKKVFVSPGVYTSETELSFVAQSVGVTTLGLVGETLKGPAFEPIFITNFDEFTAFFGGTDPEKFVNTQIPKYEASYIAKSYLQQSNQMFFTRILGLSGYDAGPSWTITANANVDGSTIGFYISEVSAATQWSATLSGNCDTSEITFVGLPSILNTNLDKEYRLNDGSTSTLKADFVSYACSFLEDTSLSANTMIAYGSIPDSTYTSLIIQYTNVENVYGVDNVDIDNNDLTSNQNSPWYYANFGNSGGNSYTGYSCYYVFTGLTGSSNTFTGGVSGYSYTFTGTNYSEYNNVVLATIRSRGVATYDSTNHGPVYEVDALTNLSMVTSGEYADVLNDPYATFLISGITKDAVNFSFDVSLMGTSSKFITKVLGVDNFGKPRLEVPVYVEEVYPGALNHLYSKGYIRGLNSGFVALPEARTKDATSIAWNLEKYTSPATPFLVSELRGNKVYKLFRFVSISDGQAANTEIKVSIANISFDTNSFDVLVRSFYDTDSNPVVIEKFKNCNLNPDSNSFVAKKIGTVNGEYALLSKYIMIEMSDEFPYDALPCGFFGYEQREYETIDNLPPVPVYKTKYYYPGETIYDPPFYIASSGVINASTGDNVRRSYLGFSSQFGIDESLLQYKGKRNPDANVWEVATDSTPWNYLTRGFHMDSGATVVEITDEYLSSGKTAFDCGVADFRSDPQTQENPYYYIYSRKYTVCFAGGFDGWDVYGERRFNDDRFKLGAAGYLSGAAPSVRYPTATGDGLFKRIVVQNNTQDFANTDYYAYLLGILTFNNPESTNINVFATSSIDFINNFGLVTDSIGMVQFNRADSVYIMTTPDYDMLTADGNNPQKIIYPQDAVDLLSDSELDSSYTATYYPWILVRDSVSNTQIYLPPTGEVCRNLALTDNISFPWFASAGYTRGLVNSVKARLKLTQEDRDTLYQGRINPIATFSDVGTVIWGNKTLQIKESALDRLNVRRLLLQARKLISAVAVRLLFEQNDQIVRQQFLDSVNPILDGIRRDRGLYDFRVTVSNAPEDLDRQTLSGRIYLKPTKALEFIEIEFFITPSGASFENI